MLSHLRAESGEMLKEVRPHMDFSYGRGVVFDKDLYEFDEEEILDMCPTEVFHVKKLRGTSMIVLTFNCPDAPSHIIIENERISVRPFKRKPLQCYNCYKFGHPSTTCREATLCPDCSSPVHGACTDDPKCVNCGQGHKSRDKDCPSYKAEEAALRKSKAEHISVQYAKRLLGHRRTYSQVVRKQPSQSKAQQPSTSSRGSPVESKAQQPSTSSSGSPVKSVAHSRQPSAAAEAAPSSSDTQHSHHASSLPVSGSSENTLPAVARTDSKVQPAADVSVGSPLRGKKRGGVSSTPSSPTLSIPTSNKFEVLSVDAPVLNKGSSPAALKKGGSPVASASKKIRVEAHDPVLPDSGQGTSRTERARNGKNPAGSAGRPSLSRPSSEQSVRKKSLKAVGNKHTK